jgi:hypothetical protein
MSQVAYEDIDEINAAIYDVTGSGKMNYGLEILTQTKYK